MTGLCLITFAFGVVASLIAFGKGRNAFGWLLAGTVIGPFSLIVAALPAVERPGYFKKCSVCREVIHEQASTCRYCGSCCDVFT